MKRIANNIIKKLKSRSGESIGEVLVALLISGLALLMLAGAITSSSHLVETSRAKEAEYYEENDNLNTRLNPKSGNWTITVDGTSYDVYVYENNKLGKPVVAYDKKTS